MEMGRLTLRELSATAVAEEAAEVAIEISKGYRFGWDTPSPKDCTTPAERLSIELGDLAGSIQFFIEMHPEVRVHEELFLKARDAKRGRLIASNQKAA